MIPGLRDNANWQTHVQDHGVTEHRAQFIFYLHHILATFSEIYIRQYQTGTGGARQSRAVEPPLVEQRARPAGFHRECHIGSFARCLSEWMFCDRWRRADRQLRNRAVGRTERVAGNDLVFSSLVELHIAQFQFGSRRSGQVAPVQAPLIAQRRDATSHHAELDATAHRHSLTERLLKHGQGRIDRQLGDLADERAHPVAHHDAIISGVG